MNLRFWRLLVFLEIHGLSLKLLLVLWLDQRVLHIHWKSGGQDCVHLLASLRVQHLAEDSWAESELSQSLDLGLCSIELQLLSCLELTPLLQLECFTTVCCDNWTAVGTG